MQKWEKISERIAYSGWRKIIVRKFLMPNGKEAEFDVIGNEDFVTIAAFTENQEAILVNQFRVGAEREIISFPEGAIDEGEKLEDCAARELLEETGFQAEKIVFLKTFHQAYFTQKQHVLLAMNCKKVAEQNLDENEFIEVLKMPLDEFRAFIKNKNDERINGNVAAAYLALDELGWL
ncbi:MAG: NUDIX hydrolase [Saprospiraceae bacterium]